VENIKTHLNEQQYYEKLPLRPMNFNVVVEMVSTICILAEYSLLKLMLYLLNPTENSLSDIDTIDKIAKQIQINLNSLKNINDDNVDLQIFHNLGSILNVEGFKIPADTSFVPEKMWKPENRESIAEILDCMLLHVEQLHEIIKKTRSSFYECLNMS